MVVGYVLTIDIGSAKLAATKCLKFVSTYIVITYIITYLITYDIYPIHN
jgi:hypothetical protein